MKSIKDTIRIASNKLRRDLAKQNTHNVDFMARVKIRRSSIVIMTLERDIKLSIGRALTSKIYS